MINDWIVHKGHSSYVSPFLKISLFFFLSFSLSLYVSSPCLSFPCSRLARCSKGAENSHVRSLNLSLCPHGCPTVNVTVHTYSSAFWAVQDTIRSCSSHSAYLHFSFSSVQCTREVGVRQEYSILQIHSWLVWPVLGSLFDASEKHEDVAYALLCWIHRNKLLCHACSGGRQKALQLLEIYLLIHLALHGQPLFWIPGKGKQQMINY